MTVFLFIKLFISCQSRECDLQDFFQHANQSSSAALSDIVRLHHCQKSQIASVLEDTVTLTETLPDVEVIINYVSALVNSTQPRMSKTFE